MAARVSGGSYGAVIGLNETMKILRKADKVLYKEARKEVIKSADPIVKDARARLMPQAPENWRGWRGGYSRGAASRGIRARLRNERVTGFTVTRTIFEVVQNNAGGAIYDNAGSRGNYTPPVQRGANFVDKLDRLSGYSAQRALWPAAVKNRDKVHDSFKRATFNMADVLNEELARRGYSARGRMMIIETGYA